MQRLLSSLLLICLVFATQHTYADGLILQLPKDGANRQTAEKKLHYALRTDNYWILTNIYSKMNSGDLKYFKNHISNSISIRASWELILNKARTKDEGIDQARLINNIKNTDINRFIGFLEGRLKITIPATYEKILGTAKTTESESVTFSLKNIQDSRKVRMNKNKFLIAYGTSADLSIKFDLKLKTLKISRGGATYDIPFSYFDKDDKQTKFINDYPGYHGMTVKSYKNKLYIAIYESYYDMSLLCVDNNKIEWKRNLLLPTVAGGPTIAEYPQYSKLVFSENDVYVFVCNDSACMIESFKIANGKPSLKFSTD